MRFSLKPAKNPPVFGFRMGSGGGGGVSLGLITTELPLCWLLPVWMFVLYPW